ncbi:hypothetical protein DES36_101104 [Alkalibaculum bacchi]|uniref:Uncharacterized protein n=1 Tax=Alkalibaculum bacchi TaxID=645887 RepID=A0A366IF94_9FIRM|nr:hypothetical protein [Alkalibaculum bacchi]RBP70052.1 hypothetical protein DES36_101104 [Alkalibaculum bacchi]
MESTDIQNVEESIGKVIGVMCSRIVVNESHIITEIHILSDNQRSVKQIIRDVESLLMAKYNIKVDHKIISIAQIYEKGETPQSQRLQIGSVEYGSYNMQAKAKVTLECDGKTYEGKSEGIRSTSQINRLIAEATLDAIEIFLNYKVKFILEEIKLVSIAGREVVLLALYEMYEQREKLFVGKCIVESDINTAIIKAVLNSINRQIRVIP